MGPLPDVKFGDVYPQPRAEVLATARMHGVREVDRVGGAQTVAALAYGTETVARVDKTVGSGNLYVTATKKLVSFDCFIDFIVWSHGGRYRRP